MTTKSMNSLVDYEVGDVLELTRRFGDKDQVFKVDVINVNYLNNGLVTYVGNESGAGAFNPKDVGVRTRYLHIVSVKKVGHNSRDFHPPWSGLSHKEAMRQYGVG
jgi:hypothetical protein